MEKKITAVKILCNIGKQLFFDDSSSSEDDNIKIPVIKIENYVNTLLNNQSPIVFQQHFRINRDTFQWLLLKLNPKFAINTGKGRTNITTENKILIGLWYLATQEVYRSIAERFDVSESTAFNSVRDFCESLVLLNSEEGMIKWPERQKMEIIKDEYKTRYSFPGTIGSIDGCHLRIKGPKQNESSYFCRKGFHSIVLQAIAIPDLSFIDVYAGEVGSVHDACVFRRSEIGRLILNSPSTLLHDDEHILGDPAYPLLNNLMVPFKDNGRLNNIQKAFNSKLSKARSCVERSFALLKCRFRRLQFIDMNETKKIPEVIVACCILHNICIGLNDNLAFDFVDEDDNDNENPGDIPSGQLKRDQLANLLSVLH